MKKVSGSDAIVKDKQKRGICFEFIKVPNYYKTEESKEINAVALEFDVRTINPKMIFMVICFSKILDMKFLFEEKGLFPELRMNRDLKLLSKGHFLTLSPFQKKIIETVAENIEKFVRISGNVGSGKTLMGLEIVKMKLSYYKKKYNLDVRDSEKKLRLVINIHRVLDESLLKQQLLDEFAEIDLCDVEIYTLDERGASALVSLVAKEAKASDKYLHTLIWQDEVE